MTSTDSVGVTEARSGLPAPRRLAILIALTAAYVAGGKLGLSLASVHPSATAVWPPTGIALAAMLLLGPWAWPAVFAGAFVVNLTTAGTIGTAFGIAAGNTLEALAGGWLVRRWAGGAHAFERSGNVFRFAVLGGLIAPLVSAAIGVTTLALGGLAAPESIPRIALTWWLGNAAGVLVLCPLIVLVRERDGIRWGPRTVLEAAAVVLLLVATTLAVFGGVLPGGRNGPLSFLCVPPLIWAAFRFGRREAAIAIALVSLVANVATFGRPVAAAESGASLLMLESFMGVLALMTLAISATVRQRRLAQQTAQRLNDELEGRIAERTAQLESVNQDLRGQVERRLRSDESLKRSEARLLEAQRIAHIGSWEWDLETGALWWSDELHRIYGLEPGGVPLTYEAFLGGVHPEDRARVDAIVRQAHEDGQPFRFEHRVTRPDGEVRTLYAEGQVMRGPGGEIRQMGGIGQDVTERKHAEEERSRLQDAQRAQREAEEANRRKDAFLAMLSHELRTPLSAITGWCQLLSDGALDEAATRRAIEIIGRNARVQSRLISDILDIARLDSDKLALQREPVLLGHVIGAALDTVRPLAAEKRVTLATDLGTEPALVTGDADRLQQVVWNLLANAIKFAPESGTVEVRLTHRVSEVALEVRDDGTGIDPAFLPHMFEAFRQDDTSTTRRHGGLGLGLAIAHRIVELHEGTILAANRSDRTGASFTVTLPARASQLDVGSAEPVQRPPRLEGLRLLVVDDDPDTREVLAAGLTGYGARVVTRASADEALAALDREPFDVLVSDIAMPRRDGCDLIRAVRVSQASFATIPAIALTAYSGAEDVARVLEAGFQMHIAKPVDTLEVARILSRLAHGATLWTRA